MTMWSAVASSGSRKPCAKPTARQFLTQLREFLQREVVLSPAFAKEEVDRFTFRAPGQATSYFYGYTRLLELRAEVEKKLGANFDAQRFHDLILAQGLLPPDLLRRAVLSAL